MIREYPGFRTPARLCAFVLCVLALIGFSPSVRADMLSVPLSVDDYRVQYEEDGSWRIAVEGFAPLAVSGRPALPSRIFNVPLPPGAVVEGVSVRQGEFEPVPVRGEPARVAPTIHTRVLEDGSIESVVLESDPTGEFADLIPTDPRDPYPAQVVSFLGEGTSLDERSARIRFQPFRYHEERGVLERVASLEVEIRYHVVSRVAESGTIIEMAEIVDLAGLAPAVHADYIVVAANDPLRQTLADFKDWKESIGHTVEIITVAEIVAAAVGCDNAERIYNFLRSRYLTYHSLKYVLLVGDIDTIPMRLLYPDDKGWPYASDYYYAKLTIPTWDKDGDKRWGEFVDDAFDPAPDVYVGRLPFNSTTLIGDIADNIIAFEQDSGPWKHDALLPYGMMDPATDGAKLGKHVVANLLEPQGWDVTTLYEKAGIQPSPEASDLPLSAANVTSSLQAHHYGIVNPVAHGGPGGMASQHWAQDKNHDGKVTVTNDSKTNELGWTWFSRTGDITAAGDVPSIVMLTGCSTSPPIAGGSPFSAVANNQAGSEQLLLTPRTNHIGKEYLRRGAVAVIGSTAGSDYHGRWANPTDGGGQSLNYYFLEELIRNRKAAGAALYDALHRYHDTNGAARGIRVFYLQGDPSLRLDGFDMHPGGMDTEVHRGTHYAFSADTANDGTLYAAVLTSAQNQRGVVKVYRSSDHGNRWALWRTLYDTAPILDVFVVVSEWSGEFADARVHVFTSTASGRVQVDRIERATARADRRVIMNAGASVVIERIAASRTAVSNMPMLHVAFHYLDTRTGNRGVRVARSGNQGVNWNAWYHYPELLDPSIEAGPSGRVYLVARKMLNGGYFDDVLQVATSTNSGASFGPWKNLTTASPGTSHGWSAPVVAASSDPRVPTVWVAYSTFRISSTSAELEFAYSENGGGSWKTGGGLSGGPAPEALVDLRSFKAHPSRWINTAYIRDPASPQVIWRYTTGSQPEFWSPERLENDYVAQGSKAEPPQILYSPGAPRSGSGVLYATRDGIRFSASWLDDIKVFAATGLPRAIPDNLASGIVSTTSVGDPGDFSKVTVSVAITHTWIGDLVLRLDTPNGTYVLHNRAGGSQDNLSETYELEGAAGAGVWTLRVSDNAGYDIGTLDAWSVRFESSPMP